MSHPSPYRRLALKLFALYVALTVSVYVAVAGIPGQHWSARLLGSLVTADGIGDIALALYLRLILGRPRRNEMLFLGTAVMTAVVGWYSVWSALSFPLVAGVTIGLILVHRWLKPHLFDPWWSAHNGNFVTLAADDAGLVAAKAEAQATLPEFLRRLSAPGADVATAAVKAPLPVPGGTEHVWIADLRRDGDEFVGIVDNHPSPETGVRIGATVRVHHSQISDWKIVEQGQLIGGFTIRYFVSRMSAAQREALSAGLPFAIGAQAIPPAA